MARERLEAMVLEAAKIYATACEVPCKVVKASGELLGHFGYEAAEQFCHLVAGVGRAIGECRHSNLYGGFQAEKLGQEYIYFCPYGLVNWAVPVIQGDTAAYYLIGGPAMIHAVDDLLLEDISQRSPQIERERAIAALQNVPNVNTTRVRYLARLLFGLVQGTLINSSEILLERQNYNRLGAGIAETIHELKAGIRYRECYPLELETDLVARVKIGDKQGAREVLNEILGVIYFEDTAFKLKKSRLIQLTAVLARAAIEAGADLEVIFGLEYSYLTRLEQGSDLIELSSLLSKVLERFIECAFTLRTVKNRDVIFKAIHYIRRHYQTNISLDDVSQEVGLNSAYFSKLFKEEVGITYTEYLNKVRVEAAKLLMQKDTPLAEVSLAVGFNDQSYFSKVFKKHTGLSPRRWRLKTTNILLE